MQLGGEKCLQMLPVSQARPLSSEGRTCGSSAPGADRLLFRRMGVSTSKVVALTQSRQRTRRGLTPVPEAERPVAGTQGQAGRRCTEVAPPASPFPRQDEDDELEADSASLTRASFTFFFFLSFFALFSPLGDPEAGAAGRSWRNLQRSPYEQRPVVLHILQTF